MNPSRPRVVVLGEKPQGATWLKFLLESNRFEIVAGVPRHKEPGWWEKDDFETILREHHIPIHGRDELANIEYDILWSLMYGYIIEAEHIDRARWYGLNLHESPLPRYRGCNGYTHAILEGAATYGTTFHFLASALDAGSMIDQEIFPIDANETSKELYVRTIDVSNVIFRRNIPAVADKSVKGTSIDVAGEPIRKRSSLLELKEIPEETLENPEKLYAHVRAFDFLPFEPAFTMIGGKKKMFFLDGSLPRERMAGNIPALKGKPDASMLQKSPVSLLTDFPRPIVVMDAEIYAKRFPIFVQRYSWIPDQAPVE